MSIYKQTFDNADLNVSHQLSVNHAKNTSDVFCKWYDENGIERATSDLIQVVDANNIILSCNEAITGTHTFIMVYELVGETTAGRRLFELSTETDPVTTLRIAFGKASTPATNMTLAAFLTWLLSKLGFLKVTYNLADIDNAATARGNLNVYSTSQVNTALATKASLYQAGSGAVLGIANTSIYNPSTNYHPATLKNVKNLGICPILQVTWTDDVTQTINFRNSALLTGVPTFARTGTGEFTVTHNYGNTNYFVLANTEGATQTYVTVLKITKNANTFVLRTGYGDVFDGAAFHFLMFVINAYTA